MNILEISGKEMYLCVLKRRMRDLRFLSMYSGIQQRHISRTDTEKDVFEIGLQKIFI